MPENQSANTSTNAFTRNDELASTIPSKNRAEISPIKSYFKLWSFATPFDVVLRCLAALAAAGSGLAEPLMALVFGDLVNLFNGSYIASPAELRSKINKNALYFIYLFLGKFTCTYIAVVLFNYTASRITGRIRLRYLRHVLHQPISYFDTNAPGTIATSLTNDTSVVQVGLAEKLAIVFQALTMMVCALIIGFTQNWKLMFATITPIPWVIVTTGYFGGLNAKVQSQVSTTLNLASGIAEEALSSAVNITAMGAADKIVRRYAEHITQGMRQWTPTGPIFAFIYGNMAFSTNSAYAIALFYGVKLVNRDEIADGGTVVTVLFCSVMASSAMSFIAPILPDFIKAAAASQHVVKAIGNPVEGRSATDGDVGEKINNLEGDLEIKDISFCYPERPKIAVIKNLSLRIPKNKVTAIVGPSGSGKSTVIGLLQRWYTPGQGSISVDGIHLDRLNLKWWRSKVGLVQQEPMLFNDTIYQNVLNGLQKNQCDNLSHTKKLELVISACKQANAHDFISKLPGKYETLTGERATALSGGQKQRIAIARSIISNPTILLLDEATSALDSASERTVSDALEKASQDRTTVMITHKLSTAMKANSIVVFDKGSIIEQGTHAELLALNGKYCRMLLAQGAVSNQSSTKNVPVHPNDSVGTVQPNPESTQDKAPTDQSISPLESVEVRRRSLFWCIYRTYMENPTLIWPSLLAAAAAIAAGASFPVQAFIFSRFVTVFQASGAELMRRGDFWALMFFILGISTLISYMVGLFVQGLVSTKLVKIYWPSYLKAMLHQDISFFQHTGNTSGGFATLLAADGQHMLTLYSLNLGLVISMVTNLIAGCILAIATEWKLGLIAVFGCLPIMLAAGFMRSHLDQTAQDRNAAAFLECARYSTEIIAAIRTVSSFAMESKVEDVYHEKLKSASDDSFRKALLSMVFYACGDSLGLAASALIFWYGGRLVSFVELSSNQFFLIFAAILYGAVSSAIIFGFSSSMNKAQAGMNRILYLTQSKPPINSSTGLDPTSSPIPPSTPTIQLHDLHFCYPARPETSILRGLSLSIPRGSHVCIVGPSGCGKSTIIALIQRFYDLQTSKTPITDSDPHDSGEIRIYGRPIAEWDVHKLRSMMGLVSQDTMLYQGTIRENILLGIDERNLTPDELQARLETACQQANLHDFITSLPSSYETELGSRGVAVSGGQRQRIALARCLIRNPQILLLDEWTSALDAESETAVRAALAKIRREREGLTIVSISHQIEGMKDADSIIVVDQGFVVEQGGWKELMRTKGRLWRMLDRS